MGEGLGDLLRGRGVVLDGVCGEEETERELPNRTAVVEGVELQRD